MIVRKRLAGFVGKPLECGKAALVDGTGCEGGADGTVGFTVVAAIAEPALA